MKAMTRARRRLVIVSITVLSRLPVAWGGRGGQERERKREREEVNDKLNIMYYW